MYQVKSEKIAEEIAKRIEIQTDLLKNFKKGFRKFKMRDNESDQLNVLAETLGYVAIIQKQVF